MFAVLQAHSLPEHLHGYLSRFFSEADTGLYVGVISRAVLEQLWERCLSAELEGSITLIHSQFDSEQGFSIRTTGPQRRPVLDFDGLTLTTRGRVENGRVWEPRNEEEMRDLPTTQKDFNS
ncbi:type I-E CRISPR-associated endoribonuclease Cas2 [Corynebacterium poyangense]|uniref:Type I-E CRISPR-associated endoribonuclease Cas2 n=1 Tax=Corynebacterium poyangense TaxID=2684405 RepID=A0A7H0SQ70_9CORY|nr:type I-E CRISPR-associated endoribonuclease Cas2e [Corynebacterium poyangense]MBZ8178365.1 type I-E CRISPR-associated endoribonuclease Cas2 [Corynebacterium poyangense]QNQ90695.1 type I-E CRISPR-associated endoribonuclease Cas2 [Corynebacterium poyangense]